MNGSVRTSYGLTFVLVGFLVISVGAVFYIILPFTQLPTREIVPYLNWVASVATAIALLGKYLCFTSSEGALGKHHACGSCVISLVVFLTGLGLNLGWFNKWLYDDKTRYFILYARWMISAVGFFLFLLYLRRLADFVDHDNLIRKVGRAVLWYRLEFCKILLYFSLALLAVSRNQSWPIHFLDRLRNPRLYFGLFLDVDLIERIAQFTVFFSLTLLLFSIVAYSRLLIGVRNAVRHAN